MYTFGWYSWFTATASNGTVIRDLTLYLRQPAFDAALSSVGQYSLSQNNSAHSLWYE
ncbi:MAG: hypothetical protein KME29_40035 [Calothrix sp. FI2-JRJ7]|nr:hypothetical protein [Calothrix sp. FI2-JRJ7]